MARLRWIVVATSVSALLATITLGIAGYFLFTRQHGDPVSKSDAIVVLGGDEDGRVDYGLSLARQGYANTVVLSNSYGDHNAMIRRACASGTATITVICFRPDPFTTRGEAMFVQRLATQRGWNRVLVVSWNFHMVRARYIFSQCLDGTVTMHPVPRSYDYTVQKWALIYLYQYGGLLKAAILGCDRDG